MKEKGKKGKDIDAEFIEAMKAKHPGLDVDNEMNHTAIRPHG